LAATLILSQIALVATGLVALLTFPLVSGQFFGRAGRWFGNLFMVILRSTPEYVLCYVFLQLWGPSMLPAIAALSLHNGGIIGTLTGRHADTFALRPNAPTRRLDRYGYEILPRVYGQFLAFLFYRWEIIMRETAILGILGVRTLGFYVDSAISEVRFDRVVVLLMFTAVLNIGVDALSRAVRARLRLGSRVSVTAA
jgi:phosphonate transport system permease protein